MVKHFYLPTHPVNKDCLIALCSLQIFFHDLFDASLADDIRQLVFFDIRRALDAVHALFTV